MDRMKIPIDGYYRPGGWKRFFKLTSKQGRPTRTSCLVWKKEEDLKDFVRMRGTPQDSGQLSDTSSTGEDSSEENDE